MRRRSPPPPGPHRSSLPPRLGQSDGPRPYEQLDRAAMVQRPRSISRTLQTTDRWVRAASREDMVAVRRRPRRADRATYELVATQELSRNGTAERVQHL